MKVLHVGPVSPDPRASGPTQSISGLVTAQAGLGAQVGLISTSHRCKPGQKPGQLAGVQIIDNLCRSNQNPLYVSAKFVNHIIERFGVPDIVHFHGIYIPMHAAMARMCRKKGWPYIITPRGSMTRVAQDIKRLKKMIGNMLFFRHFACQARAIHALTEGEASEAKQIFNVRKMFVVPNGVDGQLFAISRQIQPAQLNGFAEDQLLLGFVGRIDVHIKGLDLLLQAIASLKAEDKKCKLMMVGPFHTDRDRQYFTSFISDNNLEDVVRIVGPKFNDDKWRHFMACDAFVLSSRSEGMPMAVLEAMALARPCLVTEQSRVADIVCRGGGWSCNADADSIKSGIEQILNHRDELKERGLQSQDLIKSEFTWQQIAERLLEEYQKIASLDTVKI